jgi:hypothetical protein
VSFDLVVWAMDGDASADDVGAAYELCQQGEHDNGGRDPRIAAFHEELTSAYPVRNKAWTNAPHVASDHVEMKVADDAADEVLLEIERLAGVHRLLLLDPQGGTVYRPEAAAR